MAWLGRGIKSGTNWQTTKAFVEPFFMVPSECKTPLSSFSKTRARRIFVAQRNGNRKCWGRAYAEGLASPTSGRDFNTSWT